MIHITRLYFSLQKRVLLNHETKDERALTIGLNTTMKVTKCDGYNNALYIKD